jgi:hypothetical protein
VRLEGLGKLKNPVASSGIETTTFRLVAQCLNQLRYRVPLYVRRSNIILKVHISNFLLLQVTLTMAYGTHSCEAILLAQHFSKNFFHLIVNPAIPDFLRSRGSGTGSTQPREDK